MSFIYMIIMGLIVGVIARAIKPGADGNGLDSYHCTGY